MKKFIALLEKDKQPWMDGKMVTLDFLQALYNIYEELGQFFFHTYTLVNLFKER